MSSARALCLALALSAGCHAAGPPPVLPLRTLRLYETGVGYFERQGRVSKTAVTLPVPSGHLDDALKTLVVTSDDARSRVHGLSYASSLSRGMARALAGLPTTDGPITYRDLLASLKGAAVELTRGREVVRGRLVDVVGAAEADLAGLMLLLITDGGGIRRFAANEVGALRPRDPALAARLGAALDALSSRGAQAQRVVRVLARSDAPVTLGYVAEAPAWRATYRLVLGGRGGPSLQGWALLHNDTDEDWAAVRVQLVNGQPDSFLFPLAAPRYHRRPLVHPDQELSTVPQLLDRTVDGLWGDHVEGEGAAELGELGTVGRGSGSGSGYGYGAGRGRLHGSAAAAATRPSALLSIGDLSAVDRAEGRPAGALFSYALGEALALEAHGSALVPFLEEMVTAEEITWFAQADEPARRGVRLTNSTRQTLPAGPIAFFGRGGFLGEAGLERLTPGQQRFILHGADLDVTLAAAPAALGAPLPPPDEPRALTFDGATLEEHFVRRRAPRFRLESRAEEARTVCLQLDVVDNATVVGADALAYHESDRRPVAIFRLGPRARLERTLSLEEALSRRTTLAALTAEALSHLAAASTLPPAARAAAREAAAKQAAVEITERALAAARKEQETIERDLERFREHLKAWKGEGATAASNPLVQRILAAEDRLTTSRAAVRAHERRREEERAAVAEALRPLGPGGSS